MKTLILASILAISAPFVIGAAERALTLNSLEQGYEERLAYYDAEAASTTKAIAARDVKTDPRKLPAADYRAESFRLAKQLSDIQRDRAITEAAYELLQASLR